LGFETYGEIKDEGGREEYLMKITKKWASLLSQ
jgi:hypothetical protein